MDLFSISKKINTLINKLIYLISLILMPFYTLMILKNGFTIIPPLIETLFLIMFALFIIKYSFNDILIKIPREYIYILLIFFIIFINNMSITENPKHLYIFIRTILLIFFPVVLLNTLKKTDFYISIGIASLSIPAVIIIIRYIFSYLNVSTPEPFNINTGILFLIGFTLSINNLYNKKTTISLVMSGISSLIFLNAIIFSPSIVIFISLTFLVIYSSIKFDFKLIFIFIGIIIGEYFISTDFSQFIHEIGIFFAGLYKGKIDIGYLINIIKLNSIELNFFGLKNALFSYSAIPIIRLYKSSGIIGIILITMFLHTIQKRALLDRILPAFHGLIPVIIFIAFFESRLVEWIIFYYFFICIGINLSIKKT